VEPARLAEALGSIASDRQETEERSRLGLELVQSRHSTAAVLDSFLSQFRVGEVSSIPVR
jgi:hypothetical protein